MRFAFVLNPAARSGRTGLRRAALAEALRAGGIEGEISETQRPGDGEPLARRLAERADVVVAVGGDGTIQEVVNGLAGTDTVFGVLPMGTGNDFAHALGMPDGLVPAVQALAAAEPTPIDLGRVRWTERADGGDLVQHQRLFANCLGAGFDALAALGAARTKWIGGRGAYLAAVLRGLWIWRTPRVSVQVVTSDVLRSVAVGAGSGDAVGLHPDEGEVVFEGPLFLCEVGNGHSVGGGFLLTPEAVPNDGLLDVCVARHFPTRRALRILPTAFSGTHTRFPEVETYRARRVTIRATTGALPVQADGEGITLGAHVLDAEVWPAALQALAPGLSASETAA